MRFVVALLAALLLAVPGSASAVATLGPGPGLPAASKVVIGHSVLGRRITAYRYGDADSPRKALVVGNIHGDEPEGMRVIRAIRSQRARIHGMDLWVIDTVNPDGLRARTRQNARGVDLNRNFDRRWRRNGSPGARYYGGRRPFSEPESRAVRDLVLRLKPAVTIWYHQPYGFVFPPGPGGELGIVRDYAALTGNAVRNTRGIRYTGTATMWQAAVVPGSTAFVVELPGFPLTQARIERHARAVLRVTRLGARAR
ncbi:MAG: murein peptide amidase [Thermoleophilaceae bacterium]|jgi:protein MpaA|nr:murein peptide amidase [Thermoleophilaceae bacterium]